MGTNILGKYICMRNIYGQSRGIRVLNKKKETEFVQAKLTSVNNKMEELVQYLYLYTKVPQPR